MLTMGDEKYEKNRHNEIRTLSKIILCSFTIVTFLRIAESTREVSCLTWRGKGIYFSPKTRFFFKVVR